MSLTYNDLQEIRKVVEETISPIDGDIKALGEDIKEIYSMIADLQKMSPKDTSLQKLSVEKKLLKLHSELIATAEQAGVKLPS